MSEVQVCVDEQAGQWLVKLIVCGYIFHDSFATKEIAMGVALRVAKIFTCKVSD